MALSANTSTNWAEPMAHRPMIQKQVAGSVRIYKGAVVGRNPAGYAKPFEPGDEEVVGIAAEEFYNSSATSGATSDLGTDNERGKSHVKVYTEGDAVLTITGVGEDDEGKAVYATDDGTFALTGNADAFVGRIRGKHATNKAIVRLKQPGEKTRPSDLGSYRLFENATVPFTATGATAGTSYLPSGLVAQSALGLGCTFNAAAAAQLEGEFDATAEVAFASYYGQAGFAVASGIRMRCRLVVTNKGDNAALDTDWGLGTLLVAASIADMSDAAMIDKIAFHMDGNSDNILGWSENNATEVTPVDTTIDNDSTGDTYKDFIIVVRKSGTCELWIDSGSGFVRVLSSTALAVATGVSLYPFVNMEKTSDDTVAVYLLRELEVTGARTTTVG